MARISSANIVALLVGSAASIGIVLVEPAAGQQSGSGCVGPACPPLGIEGRAPESSASQSYRGSYSANFPREFDRDAGSGSSAGSPTQSKAGRCGTNMFYDRKTDKCIDARSRK